MDEWLDGDITDSELVETIGETLESFDKEDDEACSYRISSLQYLLIRQMIGEMEQSPGRVSRYGRLL